MKWKIEILSRSSLVKVRMYSTTALFESDKQ
jgi:hypothetical protein